jgi:hypothetical protein
MSDATTPTLYRIPATNFLRLEAEIAKMNALHRDLAAGTKTGVTTEDLRSAVQKTYRQQRGVNHSYDLQDFAEKLGIQPKDMQIERCFGAA